MINDGVWGCFENAHEMSWGCFGDALEMCWSNVGDALGVFRVCLVCVCVGCVLGGVWGCLRVSRYSLKHKTTTSYTTYERVRTNYNSLIKPLITHLSITVVTRL